MTRSYDLGNGPHRAFGSALAPRYQRTIEKPDLITERPRKLQGSPPCEQCGERIFYCDCEEISGSEGAVNASSSD